MWGAVVRPITLANFSFREYPLHSHDFTQVSHPDGPNDRFMQL